jgi:hypothetical protein
MSNTERQAKFSRDNPGHVHDFKYNYDTKNEVCSCKSWIDQFGETHYIWATAVEGIQD